MGLQNRKPRDEQRARDEQGARDIVPAWACKTGDQLELFLHFGVRNIFELCLNSTLPTWNLAPPSVVPGDAVAPDVPVVVDSTGASILARVVAAHV